MLWKFARTGGIFEPQISTRFSTRSILFHRLQTDLSIIIISMQNLPIDVFNQLRGFLHFKELHTTRPVSKRWNKIERVEKRVEIWGSKMPPVRANFQSIVSLNFYSGSVEILNRIFMESIWTLTTSS
jgi:hypothetical protein